MCTPQKWSACHGRSSHSAGQRLSARKGHTATHFHVTSRLESAVKNRTFLSNPIFRAYLLAALPNIQGSIFIKQLEGAAAYSKLAQP